VPGVIRNEWRREPGGRLRARILARERQPEGLDVDRIRFVREGELALSPEDGHVLSVLRGEGAFLPERSRSRSLRIGEGVHLYVAPGGKASVRAGAEAQLLRVSGPSGSPCGPGFLLRDEAFLSGCASGGRALRWVLTPQYLSRRVFLHHDATLTSRAGSPVSWFRTTMFDVCGLPANEDGESVFKMSYNSRTEFNVCYDVAGSAHVRMAQHPYAVRRQAWRPWVALDGESTYHLDESAGGPDEEHVVDMRSGETTTLRNKHEVRILQGHVTLFCMFDPAPTGVERHQPGEYSDYEPLARVLRTPECAHHVRESAAFDAMVNELSLARAEGTLDRHRGSDSWDLYLSGRQAQRAIEQGILTRLDEQGAERHAIIAPWLSRGLPPAEARALYVARERPTRTEMPL